MRKAIFASIPMFLFVFFSAFTGPNFCYKNSFWKNYGGTNPYDNVSTAKSYGELTYIGNNPSGAVRDWCPYLNGLAYGEMFGVLYAFFSCRNVIYYWPLNECYFDYGFCAKENGPKHYKLDLSELNLGQNYFHMGDIAFSQDGNIPSLYIPVESKNKSVDPAILVKVGIFDMSMKFNLIYKIPMPEVKDKDNTYHSPWVAIHPLNKKLIFTSTFNLFWDSNAVDHDNVTLKVYEESADGTTAQFVGNFPIFNNSGKEAFAVDKKTLYYVQGGDFSPNGYLFLLADGPKGSGLYVFEGETGQFVDYEYAQYDDGQEFEGVAVYKFDKYGALKGEIHTFTHTDDDENWLKHFSVEFPDNL